MMGRKKGTIISEEQKMKQRETMKQRVSEGKQKGLFQKGCIPHNKGKKMEKGIGKDHPSWNGGSSRYWGYKTLLESGKRKDQCQICKDVKKTIIHHINGNSKDNSLKNLGVVCTFCHNAIHDNGKGTRFQVGHPNLNFGGGY